MGFLKGGVTFVRFRVCGEKPRAFGPEHLERLREFAEPVSAAADGTEAGWRAGGHIHDADFTLEKNVYPDHLAWDFRVQRDALPADRLKAYTEIELKALAAGNPSGHPSARQKREAREAARERLEDEAKDGRYRKWTLVPCLWDAVRNEVMFGSASLSHVERFAALFGVTFRADLFQTENLGSGLTALTAGAVARRDDRAEEAAPAAFVPGVSPPDVAWIADETSRDYLGNEFLLWLWFHTEAESDTVALPDGTEAAVMMARSLTLECPRGVTGRETITHEGPTRLPEAKRAVQSGKLPRKAGLTVVRHDDQFEFTLHAETLAVAGAKLPRPADDLSGRAVVEGRLDKVRGLVEAVEGLYGAFLAARLSADWPGVLARVQRWLARGRTGEAAA